MNPRTKSSRSSTLVLLFGAAIVLLIAVAVPWRNNEETFETRILRIFEEEGQTDLDLEASLAALGPDALDGMFTALLSNRIGLRDLAHSERQALEGAMAKFGPQALTANFLCRFESGGQTRAVTYAIQILAPECRAEHLRMLSSVAATAQPSESVGIPFRDAVADVLTRDREAFGSLAAAWRSLPDPLRVPLIEAIGRVGDPRGLAFLADNLGFDDKIDVALLDQIIRLVPKSGLLDPDAIAAPLRRILERGNGSSLQKAVIAVGQMRDEAAIPLLIELLESDSRGLLGQVGVALKRISGLSFRADQPRWMAWYEAESQWFDENGADSFANLYSEDSAVVIASVRSLAKRKLFRHRISNELVFLLGDVDASIRMVVCQALSQLRSPTAVPALIESLQDANESVAQNAWSALCALTGRRDPIDSDAWSRLSDELAL